MQVLLAEDEAVNQKFAALLLERKGHEVKVAENGAEPVEEEAYDLVLMDVQMPQVSGLEATRKIREREAETEEPVPIVALTVRATEEDRKKCLEAGMSVPVEAGGIREARRDPLGAVGD